MADAALSQFCQAEHGRLVGALTLYTGDRELALELAQEALARVVRDWHRIQRAASPGAYAHRVAINLANRTFTRRRAERAAYARGPRLDAAVAAPDVEGPLVLRAAVAALPQRQREALVLRFYVDLSVDEAARLMHCRPGTVKALTHQAIAALRELDEMRELAVEERP